MTPNEALVMVRFIKRAFRVAVQLDLWKFAADEIELDMSGFQPERDNRFGPQDAPEIQLELGETYQDEQERKGDKRAAIQKAYNNIQNLEAQISEAKRLGDGLLSQQLAQNLQTWKDRLDKLLAKQGMKVCGASWAALETLAALKRGSHVQKQL